MLPNTNKVQCHSPNTTSLIQNNTKRERKKSYYCYHLISSHYPYHLIIPINIYSPFYLKLSRQQKKNYTFLRYWLALLHNTTINNCTTLPYTALSYRTTTLFIPTLPYTTQHYILHNSAQLYKTPTKPYPALHNPSLLFPTLQHHSVKSTARLHVASQPLKQLKKTKTNNKPINYCFTVIQTRKK